MKLQIKKLLKNGPATRRDSEFMNFFQFKFMRRATSCEIYWCQPTPNSPREEKCECYTSWIEIYDSKFFLCWTTASAEMKSVPSCESHFLFRFDVWIPNIINFLCKHIFFITEKHLPEAHEKLWERRFSRIKNAKHRHSIWEFLRSQHRSFYMMKISI